MTRFTSKALLLVLTWGFFAPLATALAPVPLRACCLRKTAHCQNHSQMDGMHMAPMGMAQMDMDSAPNASSDGTPVPSLRTSNCCEQGGCCRGLSTSAVALSTGTSSQTVLAITLLVSQQQDLPRTQASVNLQEVRGPPAS